MRITWYGHACFKIESNNQSIVVDPYADNTVPGLMPVRLKADKVFCSHQHSDHNFVGGVQTTNKDISIKVSYIDTFHDDCEGHKRGPNRIHIFECEGMRVAHLGDLGCELTITQIKKLSGIDAVMIPVGGTFTINPEEAKAIVEQIKPRIVIPMHYKKVEFGFEVLSNLSEFIELVDNVVEYQTNSIDITKETSTQTAILTYLGSTEG